MRQRRWLELLKDYDTNIQYHPGKANVVADALSRKSGMIAGIKVEEEIIRDLERLDIELCVRDRVNIDQQTEFRVDDDGILWQGTKLCVPEDPTLREALMTEAHSSPFSIHPGSTKMVKIEHQRASGLLQPLEIPVWKWDEISMDFVTGLPRTQRKHDAIWVVVDRLTKSAHFLPIRKDYPVYRKLGEPGSSLVQLFIPETDGQSERTIQTLEDMLRSWIRVEQTIFFEGPEMIEVTNEKVAVAREKLKEAQTRQKSYADRHRRALEISYRYALPPQLSLSQCFHVSLLRVTTYHPPFTCLYLFDQILKIISYTEEPESILDRQDRVMRNKTIPFVKILWRNHPEREATWETEESIRTSYPHFLP
ncbi:retrotransposon protein, putative, ty3-gypsy subclass [Tanacetum coccineum]